MSLCVAMQGALQRPSCSAAQQLPRGAASLRVGTRAAGTRGRQRGRRVLPAAACADGDSATTTSASAPASPRAAFGSTPSLVKGLVSGLTLAVNKLAGVAEEPTALDAAARAAAAAAPPLASEALLAGVQADFTENGYLWTGEITASLYDADCTFTDPTLSFKCERSAL
jgi:hypothetical protein